MIDEEKVILMTKLAAFEKHQSRKNSSIINYYRGDFIGFQVVKAIIAVTISFVAVFAIYIFYNFEELMADIYKLDFMEVGKTILIIYVAVAGVYAVICYAVYAHRYSKAKKELKGYYSDLRKLGKMLESDSDYE